jgi:hypothetical protein
VTDAKDEPTGDARTPEISEAPEMGPRGGFSGIPRAVQGGVIDVAELAELASETRLLRACRVLVLGLPSADVSKLGLRLDSVGALLEIAGIVHAAGKGDSCSSSSSSGASGRRSSAGTSPPGASTAVAAAPSPGPGEPGYICEAHRSGPNVINCACVPRTSDASTPPCRLCGVVRPTAQLGPGIGGVCLDFGACDSRRRAADAAQQRSGEAQTAPCDCDTPDTYYGPHREDCARNTRRGARPSSAWIVHLAQVEGLLRRALFNGGNLHAGHEPMCPMAPGAKLVDGVIVMGTSKHFEDCSCWVREACNLLGMKSPCEPKAGA